MDSLSCLCHRFTHAFPLSPTRYRIRANQCGVSRDDYRAQRSWFNSGQHRSEARDPESGNNVPARSLLCRPSARTEALSGLWFSFRLARYPDSDLSSLRSFPYAVCRYAHSCARSLGVHSGTPFFSATPASSLLRRDEVDATCISVCGRHGGQCSSPARLRSGRTVHLRVRNSAGIPCSQDRR